MAYCAYITRIKDLRKHTNADRLQVGTCFGNNVIVSLDTLPDEIGVYFPTDGRLGVEYCEMNNLLRKKDENGTNIGGYLEPEKRHVSTLKLRGEKSDGLFMPLSSLSYVVDISTLKEGDMITQLNGTTICEKYIPIRKNRQHTPGTKPTKKQSKESYPYFVEHIDTSQLAYNLGAFREGDLCYITLKMHGTSGRTSNTIKERKTKLPYIIYKGLSLLNINIKPKKSWEYVSGSRRVTLRNFDGGFYGSDNFRRNWHESFVGKLHKGESAYYEIVGWTSEGQLIMPECSNSKTKDKEFIKQWGDTTRFTYGCENGTNDIYVYRMTMTNEDGYTIEYSTKQTQLRCEQMGVKFVPILDTFIFTNKEDLMARVDSFVEGADPVGKSHIKEGVVVRIENREKFAAYKHKSFMFKLLEGIIKSEDIIDMEENEDANNNEPAETAL
jgi:hypothetical protein